MSIKMFAPAGLLWIATVPVEAVNSAPIAIVSPAATFTFMISVCRPAVELTKSDLIRSPSLSRMSTVAASTPLSPGASTHGLAGRSTTVQPHEGVTWMMVTDLSDRLVTLKLNAAAPSPGLVSTVFSIASQASALSSAADQY